MDKVAAYKKRKLISSLKYYDANRETIKIYQRAYCLTKITCECGVQICRGGKTKHLQSKKHTNLMNL